MAAVLGGCGAEPVAQHPPAPDGKLSVADALAPERARQVLAAGLVKVLTAEVSKTHGKTVSTSSGKAAADEVAEALRSVEVEVEAEDVRPAADGAAVLGTLPASRALALLGLDSSLAARGIDSATVAGSVPVEIRLDREGSPVSVALRGSDLTFDSAHVPAVVQDEVGAASYEALVNPTR